MATLSLRCRNCSMGYTYETPYPTYVGKVGEVELTGPDGDPRVMHPSCPKCTSNACEILN